MDKRDGENKSGTVKTKVDEKKKREKKRKQGIRKIKKDII